MSGWGAIIGAVLGGIANRSAQRAEDRRRNQDAQQGLINMREQGDETRRTDMFRSDLSEYERSRDRERVRGGLENYVQFGKKPDGSNQWEFMDSYEQVNDVRETPERPDHTEYAHDAGAGNPAGLDNLTNRQRRQYDRWQRRAERRGGGG